LANRTERVAAFPWHAGSIHATLITGTRGLRAASKLHPPAARTRTLAKGIVMLRRFTAVAVLLASATGLATAADPPTPIEMGRMKRALQEVQDFMGGWTLEGTQKVGAKTEAWKEKVEFSWNLKKKQTAINVSFGEGKGKYFSKGELSYALDKKKYVLTLVDKDKKEQVFTGDLLKSGGLKLERKDEKTGDAWRITANTLADGIRLSFKVEKQDGGKGLFSNTFTMLGNKEGESLAGGSKKPECIVTGGAASIAVSFEGKQYFVCCSGCRDAFNENPEKFVKMLKK
jgi:YHS domain-containing protein